MPYATNSEVPDYVPSAKKKQWREVWNSAYERAKADGKSHADAEASAFAQANAVAGPKSEKIVKIDKRSQVGVGYEKVSQHPGENCGRCSMFEPPDGCTDVEGPIAAAGWCIIFDPLVAGSKAAFAGRKAMTGQFRKFIPFAKVDAIKREVWGVVTAEVPDKDDEVCDYFKSKPYYEAVIAEMAKATDGGNFMPLREMHGMVAAGKGIGYEFRDPDREIFMGFKVVDDKAWEKVEQKVYTGFSQGGFKIGDMVPDPVYKNCMRYVANPAEVSLVDNPCLGVAHFTYVAKTGEVELRKNRCVDDGTTRELRNGLESLREQFATFQKSVGNKKDAPLLTTASKVPGALKYVAGEDLPFSAFLLVGDNLHPETWRLPIQFSDEKKTKSFIRAAIVALNQEKSTDAVRARLMAAAEKSGIDVTAELGKLSTIRTYLRRGLRARVNKLARRSDPGRTLIYLDDDLGRLAKGMYEVGSLAQHVNCLTNLLYNVISEQEWEGDDTSALPMMLEANVNGLLDSLVEMVAEETRELREQLSQSE